MIFDLIHDLSARLPTILFITTEAVSFFHRCPSKAHQIEMVGKTTFYPPYLTFHSNGSRVVFPPKPIKLKWWAKQRFTHPT